MATYEERQTEQYSRPARYDTQPDLTAEQRRQRTEMFSAGADIAALHLDDFALLRAAQEALARIAPDATGDFRDLLLTSFSYYHGWMARDAKPY